jgi:hypothetical protein
MTRMGVGVRGMKRGSAAVSLRARGRIDMQVG